MLCCVFTQSHLTLYDSMDSSRSDSSAHRIAKQEYWSGVPFPAPQDFPNPGIKHKSLVSPALAGRFFTSRATWEAPVQCYSAIKKNEVLIHATT